MGYDTKELGAREGQVWSLAIFGEVVVNTSYGLCLMRKQGSYQYEDVGLLQYSSIK